MALSNPFSGSFGVRTLSAMVLVPLAISAAWIGGLFFAGLVLFILCCMAFEWFRPVEGHGMGAMAITQMIGCVIITIAAYFGRWDIACVSIGLGIPVMLVMAKGTATSRRWAIAGLFYISLPALAFLWIRFGPDDGLYVLVWLFICVWAMDTGAYMAGKTIGGPKMLPAVSPNKTWAGLVGGVICAALAGGFFAQEVGLATGLGLFIFSGIMGFWSQVGDLVESAFKRHFGIKDTSNLIPGHGGFMDRVDGIVFAAPLAALYLVLG